MIWRAAVLFTLLWTTFALFSSSEVYFRDGGEFVLVAFFRDVAHPAGYPTFSQLSNLLTLLPFGPIPWRVNLFSTFCAATALSLSWVATTLFLKHRFALSAVVAEVAALSSVVVPLYSQSFLRQTLTAEVYTLNALFFSLLLFVFAQFTVSRDTRYLMIGSFLGGIAVGNHVSFGGPLGIAFFLLLIQTRSKKIPIVACMACGLLGLSVYISPLIRGGHALPLRTGEPVNLSRLIGLTTDIRDRELKHDSREVTQKFSLPFITSLHGLLNDLKRLGAELSDTLLIVGFLGIVLLGIRERVLAILLLGAFSAILLFFAGWQPDPWTIPFLVVGVGVASTVGWIASTQRRISGGILACFGAAIPLLFFNFSQAATTFRMISRFDTPRTYGEKVLDTEPPHAVVIAEASWFLSSYLSAIEHYRSDLSILYQPRILFPGYFESFTLSEGNETIFTNDALRYSHDPEPQWKLLQRLIVSVAPNAPLSIEPSLVINEYLRESVTLDERGNAMLIPGVSTRFSPEYLVHKEELYSGFRDQVMQLPESISDDGMSSLENSVYNEAHLLFVTGQKREAIALLISICFPNGKNICSPYADENLKRLKGLS